MRARAGFVAVGCALALAACESQPDAGDVLPDAPDSSDPDLARGELLSLACQACHTLGPGGADLIGPNLNAMFGRRAGTKPGFVYSDALGSADFVWTPEAIDAWLADPGGFIVGTTMAFTGYQSARDRRDLVAFLLRATAPPQ